MFFDHKEKQKPEKREQYLITRLQDTLAYAMDNTLFYGERLKELHPEQITSRAALARLPVTRKSDMIDLQNQFPPFGGLNGVAPGSVARLYQSPGPIHEPEGKDEDWWRMGRAFYAAGFRSGGVVHNTLSYHLSPGGFIMDSGARACGCAVIPAGTGQTEQQLRVLDSLRPNGYCGTPSFLKILLDRAKDENLDLSFITHALVSGEGLPESLRQAFSRQGIRCLQAYATADVGLIAYESSADEGMIVAEDIILEIVKPGTGELVEPGDVGEILVTVFNHEYPLIRFATGDLTALLPGSSSCGRTNMRIKGWMGRADQSTKVKGLFVHPNQIAEIVQRHPEIQKARLIVESIDSRDQMTLLYEAADELDQSMIRETMKIVCKLSGTTRSMEVGELASDGILIEDKRS